VTETEIIWVTPRREINENLITKFLNLLSYENWEAVFSSEDINIMFNVFLDKYIKIFNTYFPNV